jgi:hypothetical protein
MTHHPPWIDPHHAARGAPQTGFSATVYFHSFATRCFHRRDLGLGIGVTLCSRLPGESLKVEMQENALP